MTTRAKRLAVATGALALTVFAMLGPGLRALPASAAGFTAVAAGDQHTCALTSGNAIQCWGRNSEGEVGDGTTTDRLRPVVVPYLSYGASALAVGSEHSCAVLVLWTSVECWGNNASGQVGDGTVGTNRLTATTVCASGSAGSCVALTGVTAVAAGDLHTCALTSSGAVKCWGKNTNGQLGNGTTMDSPNPVDVSGLGSGVTAIVAGTNHVCALLSSGGVKCWGDSSSGQLGTGFTTQRTTPTDVDGLSSGVASLTAGDRHTCAVLTGGAMKCWGANESGQLGDGTQVLPA